MPRISHVSLVLFAAALCAGCAGPGSLKERLSLFTPRDRTTADEHVRAAVALERQGRYTDAAESFAAALKKDPQSDPALIGLARIQRRIASRDGDPVVAATTGRDAADRPQYARFPGESRPVQPARPGFAQLSRDQTVRQTASDVSQRIPLESFMQPAADDRLPEFVYRSPKSALNYRGISDRVPVNGLEIVPRGVRRSELPGRAEIALDAKPASIRYPAALPHALSPLSRESLAITQDIAALQARLVADPSDSDAIDEIVRKLGDPDSKRQWLAASILDHLARGPQRLVVVAQLSRGLRDPDSRVRLQSAVVLATLGSLAIEAVPNLRLALQDPDDAVRRASSVAIATIER